MIRKLLPILLALVGLGIGTGAGLLLRPAAEEHASEGDAEHAAPDEEAEPEVPPEYVKLNNQFVVPFMDIG